MNPKLKGKIGESLSAVLPVTAIVFLLCVTITPIPPALLLLFFTGALLLILGMGFFTLGADMAMMPIGEQVGVQLAKSKRIRIVKVGRSPFISTLISRILFAITHTQNKRVCTR